MKRKRRTCVMTILGMLVILLNGIPAFGENRIKEGMDLPDLMLEGSDCMEQTDYLGVENDERYIHLSKIPAKLMVIEFFEVHCPVCQKQAKVANKLFKILKRNPDLKNDVKIFAIGIGNKQNQINAYKKQHNVKFPVFIDPYSKLHKQHGIGQVPYTMIINKERKVLHTDIGVIENLDEFIAKITKLHEKEL